MSAPDRSDEELVEALRRLRAAADDVERLVRRNREEATCGARLDHDVLCAPVTRCGLPRGHAGDHEGQRRGRLAGCVTWSDEEVPVPRPPAVAGRLGWAVVPAVAPGRKLWSTMSEATYRELKEHGSRWAEGAAPGSALYVPGGGEWFGTTRVLEFPPGWPGALVGPWERLRPGDRVPGDLALVPPSLLVKAAT